MRPLEYLKVATFVLGLLACSGCMNRGPEVATVEGVVTMKGEPVPNAAVTFFPTSGRPSYGTSDSQGKYSLEYSSDQPGAVTGTHRVKVAVGGFGSPPMPGAPSAPSNSRSRSSGVMQAPREITLPDVQVASGTNQIDLEIPQS